MSAASTGGVLGAKGLSFDFRSRNVGLRLLVSQRLMAQLEALDPKAVPDLRDRNAAAKVGMRTGRRLKKLVAVSELAAAARHRGMLE